MNEQQIEQVNADMVATQSNEPQPRAGGYRALTIIAFILAVGGLFLGLLGRWADLFVHQYFNVPADTVLGGALDGSLFAYVYYYAKSIFDMGVWTYIHGILTSPLDLTSISLLLTTVMLALSVILSLILLIISFCSRRAAKNCATVSLVSVFLGYAGFFALTFFIYRLYNDGFSRFMFDIPTAIVAGVALICLIVSAIARRKGIALLNLVLFLLTALSIYALCNEQSFVAIVSAFPEMRSHLFFVISAIALFALVALNLLVSTIRLSARKAYVFDAVRFGLLLVASALTVVAYGLETTPRWDIFNTQLLSTILLLAAPLAAVLLSVVIAIAKASKAAAAAAETESAAIGEAEGATDPDAYAQPAQAPANTPAAENTQDVAKNVTVNVQQQPVEAPMPQNVTVNVTPAMYGQQPMMPFYPMPYYMAPAAQQPVMAQPVMAQQPAAAAPQQPAPVVYAPQPEKPQEETPMTEFERSMAALAKGIEPEPAPAPAPAPTAETVYQPAPAPVYSQPQPAKPVAPAYDASQYTYDSFINSLTPQEKNEFGDLFIANKYGDLSYLPAYSIGGDNREFFSKVFIYFGRFRGHISSSLLDKLYTYVSRG